MDMLNTAFPWMPIAELEIGVSQFPPGSSNPRIMEYHSATSLRAKDDKIAWCSSFVNWCFAQVGIAGTGSALARSWLEWGQPIDAPQRGCVIVLSRDDPDGWKGHVGFFLRADSEHVYLLCGNEFGKVCEHFYPRATVLGYRLPSKECYVDPIDGSARVDRQEG